MKMLLKTCVWAVAAVMFTGCWQKSVQPFYSEKDLKTNPSLVGDWIETKDEPEKAAKWTFRENGEKRYLLTIVDDDETIELEARLFSLRGNDFLDLCSRKRSLSEIPAHHLLRIKFGENAFEVSILSLDWVKNWVGAHPKSISHVRINDPDNPDNKDDTEIVLTAETEALQKFVLENMDKDGFFDGGTRLTRKK